MNALPSLWWQSCDCCHLVRLFRIFCNCFNLSRPQGPLQCTKKMVCLDLPMWYNANLLQPMRVTGVCWIYKCILSAMKLVWSKQLLSFVQIWGLVIGSISLSSFIQESPTQDHRTIYDKRTYVSEWCEDVRYWTENANEMIFGIYRAALPHFSNPKIRDVENILWRFFFTLSFTNILHRVGTKVLDLTGNLLVNSRMWAFRKVSFQKCRYETYRDSYRTRSAQAFSSHSTT